MFRQFAPVVCLIALAVLVVAAAAEAQPADRQRLQPAPTPRATDARSPLRLDVSASFFARYELRESYDGLGLVGRRIGELDGTAYRARLILATSPFAVRPGWDATLRFAPQASGFWGDVSAGLTDAGLGMHEAHLTIEGPRVGLDVGRFEMVYGDQLVIGDVGWHETGRSFDGVRARVSAGDARIDGFISQVAEGGLISGSTALADADVYFLGVYAALGSMIDANIELDTYILGQLAAGTDAVAPATESALELTLGSRLARTVGIVRLRLEAGVQVGQRPGADSVLAASVDAEAMTRVAPTTRAGIGALYATGDDPMTARDTGWNQLYPTAHKFLGFMDIVGPRTNVAAGTLKVRHAITPPLGLGVDAHLFARPETADGVSHILGSEADVWLGWRIGGGLSLRGQYAIFLPSADGPLATDDPAHYIELQLALER